MEMLNSSSKDADQLCQICLTKPRKYTCPRCDIGYCTVDCYKSMAHSECSESFYKDCVEEELKVRRTDTESRNKMLDILKRMKEEQLENEDLQDMFTKSDDDSEQLDSDDEEDAGSLRDRLENINLDNADEVWSALTDAERQEFKAMVLNGEADKLLPDWKPWWSREKILIQEVIDELQDSDPKKDCPELLNISGVDAVSKASPCVKFNIENVIYAYAYMAMYYNGDHHDFAKEATNVFLQLCDNVRENRIFDSSPAAAEAVMERIGHCQWLPGDAEVLSATRTSGNLIISGPQGAEPWLYTAAALSDLHRLFSSAKDISTKQGKKDGNQEFSKRFCNATSIPHEDVPKKTLQLCIKKLEYYFLWIKRCQMNL
ncbi:zinc finger HIT domain-containing protein 2 [Orussus abietinus]|uniref:zinc finger HIT domain-containing protein 2 n=1 Tax=Orussus abietinus TaxID=222816 RepID=UPI000625A125|nr:zinc finger HIT domain-containing protein 2 [Orussus abietinus]